MANYIIPENPQYTAEIRKLQNTDPANAETILNPLVETLISNTHAVKLEADKKANSGHTHSPGDCGLGKNLMLTGAVTGTYNGQAPASFLIPDRKGCRFIVGTSTNGWTEKDCDYLCDGTADQVEINNAINALPATGGEVVILDGTYNITASITVNKNNVKLRGNGNATVLKRMYNGTTSNGVIQVTGNNCCIEGFYINGNKANYNNNYNYGINLTSGNNNTITNNICNNNSYVGIFLFKQNNNIVTGNICYDNSYGIYIQNSNDNTITGNVCNGNNYGISLFGSRYNNIAKNTCNSNNTSGININSSSINNVSGNTIYRESYTSDQDSIYIINSNNNLIADNLIFGKNYTLSSGIGNTFVNNKYN